MANALVIDRADLQAPHFRFGSGVCIPPPRGPNETDNTGSAPNGTVVIVTRHPLISSYRLKGNA